MDQSDGHAAVRGRLCSTGKVNSASLFSVDSSCTFVLTNYDFMIFFFSKFALVSLILLIRCTDIINSVTHSLSSKYFLRLEHFSIILLTAAVLRTMSVFQISPGSSVCLDRIVAVCFWSKQDQATHR